VSRPRGSRDEDWTRIAEPVVTPEIGSAGVSSAPEQAMREYAECAIVKVCDGGHDALIDPICQDS
jgi:hypothetical protein